MNCIFCKIINKKASSWIVYQDKYITAFFDYNPASKGHILITPNKHYKDLFETPNYLLGKILTLAKKIAIFYKDSLGIENINIIQSNGEFAGQEVFHYHLHLVPRSKNDTIILKWIPNEKIRKEFDELRDFILKGIK